MTLKVKLLNPAAKLPTIAHPGEDIAVDLYAIEAFQITCHETIACKTGIAIEFDPPAGAVLVPRSSQGKQSISIEGGQIDAGYRGEIIVLLHNNSDENYYNVAAGERIAQLKKQPIFEDNIVMVADLTPSARETKGFGSSGR